MVTAIPAQRLVSMMAGLKSHIEEHTVSESERLKRINDEKAAKKAALQVSHPLLVCLPVACHLRCPPNFPVSTAQLAPQPGERGDWALQEQRRAKEQARLDRLAAEEAARVEVPPPPPFPSPSPSPPPLPHRNAAKMLAVIADWCSC